MATISYVVNAVDSASATFARIAGSADDLLAQLDELSHKTAEARVGLEGDKEATLALDKLDLQMARLAKRVASPTVKTEGVASARLQLDRLNLELDKLDRKHVTADVDVDVDQGKIGRLFGFLRLGGGGSGGGAGISAIITNPGVIFAGVAAAIAALPFAATAAAGAIVTALGGGLTTLGVIAAAKTKQVAKPFHDLAHQIGVDMRSISVPFRDVLKDIANEAQASLPTVMIAIGNAFKAVAGPLRTFSKTVIDTLADPSVVRAIQDIGKAFGALLKALAPSMPSIIRQIADGIDGIAQAIRAHPRIFADLINFLGHLVGWSLQAIGALTRVANWLVEFTRDVGHWLRVAWNAFTGFFKTVAAAAVTFKNTIATVWDTIWRNTVTRVANGIHAVGNMFRSMWHDLIVIFGNLRHDVATVWDTIWRNTITRVSNGIRDVVGWFRGLPAKVIGALWGLGSHLYSFARSALGDFLRGMKSIAGSVLSWVGNFVKNIWNKVKGFFNMSPPHPGSLFYDLGADLMKHLGAGIRDHAHRAQDAMGGAISFSGGPVGGDPGRNMQIARRMFPFPASMWGAFVSLAMRESGFNRFARNPSSGAYGIPQALPESKLPFAGQAAGGSNAAAQLAWMFSYIRGRYGNPLNAWAHETRFGWYDQGGWLPPGLSLALNTTGRPERVGGAGTVININVAAGPGTNRRQLAQEIADVILEHTKTGGRLYPQGVTPR